MPSPPTHASPSRMLHVLDTALDQSHDVKAEVEACAADLRSANDLAKARIDDGAATLPAAHVLQNGLDIEMRVQGCADGLQEVTDNLAHGLDEVRAVEQALNLSRAALARSEAALAESRSAEPTARRPSVQAQNAGLPGRLLFDEHLPGDKAGTEGHRASAGPLPPDDADASVGVLKVLVAEDDSFMRDLVHRVLAGAGMQVMSYPSAAELLSAGNLASASVLLLDMKMPGMSGLDLQDLLRHRGVDLPVVFMSGASDMGLAVTAMRNGAADFIEKPFQGALLIERVRRAVALHTDRKATPERQADPVVMARFQTLTAREAEVFELLVTGMSSKLIARELGGSFRTIEIHRAQVMHKMAARHLSELVRMSIESMPSQRLHAR